MTSTMEQAARNSELAALVTGSMTYEWLEGEKFLIQRLSMDHPDFPDSISVIGFANNELTAHYFDSRGVFRIYRVAMEGDALRIWRNAPGFSQRLEARLSNDGEMLAGVWQLSRDDETWDDDLAITFVRATVL
jgi:hypothetical protein